MAENEDIIWNIHKLSKYKRINYESIRKNLEVIVCGSVSGACVRICVHERYLREY